MVASKGGYSLENGVIKRQGKQVGVLRQGAYQVTGGGRPVSGTLEQLVRAAVAREKTPSTRNGKLRLGPQTFEVLAGKVFFEGTVIGRVEDSGAFSVTVGARRAEGFVSTTPGVVWLGGPGGTGTVTIAGHRFTALEGTITEAGVAIGWLALDGSYRAVRPNGDFFEGRLGQLASERYFRLRFTSSPVTPGAAR